MDLGQGQEKIAGARKDSKGQEKIARGKKR